MKLLKNVLSNYKKEIAACGNKALPSKKNQFIGLRSIIDSIPNLIRQHLTYLQKQNLYKVDASIGQGNAALIPWICIYKKDITSSAENGYYIAILFSEDMQSCYFSLMQSVIATKRKYGSKDWSSKLQKIVHALIPYLDNSPNFTNGKIDLHASQQLGKAYELGTILSTQYKFNYLPTKQQFLSDLDFLLANYEKLHKVFNNTLSTILIASEDNFQNEVLELTSEPAPEIKYEPRTVKPKKQIISGQSVYVRDSKISATAIQHADFLCELDPTHKTFTSKANNHNFVEAHHLVPISKQGKFDVSLDVEANIVSLCPNCHRLLHHASKEDKQEALDTLLNKRLEHLKTSGINVNLGELLGFYESLKDLED